MKRLSSPSVRSLVVALCVAASLGSAAAAADATTGTELGGMNLSAYCQQLEAGNKGSTLSGETWVCIHADNTTAPLNLQAACEHEYKTAADQGGGGNAGRAVQLEVLPDLPG